MNDEKMNEREAIELVYCFVEAGMFKETFFESADNVPEFPAQLENSEKTMIINAINIVHKQILDLSGKLVDTIISRYFGNALLSDEIDDDDIKCIIYALNIVGKKLVDVEYEFVYKKVSESAFQEISRLFSSNTAY